MKKSCLGQGQAPLITATLTIILALAGCSASGGTGSIDSSVSSSTAAYEASGDGVIVRPTAVRPIGPTPTVPPSPFDSDADGWMDLNEYRSAVEATIPQFEWPSGYAIVVDLFAPSETSAFASAGFQINLQFAVIGKYHACVWEKRWLDATRTGELPQASQALAIMTTTVPNNIAFDPGLSAYYVEIAQRAALGDPAPVIEDLDVNCADITFVSISDASPTAAVSNMSGRIGRERWSLAF